MYKSLGSLLISLLTIGNLFAEPPKLPQQVGEFRQDVRSFCTEVEGLPDNDVREVAVSIEGDIVVRLPSGPFVYRDGEWKPWQNVELFDSTRRLPKELQGFEKFKANAVLSTARRPDGAVAVGLKDRLYLRSNGELRQLFPSEGNRRWAPTNVFVDFDSVGRLWFASQQGVGSFHDGKWTLYTGADGLPYDDMTAVTCGPDGIVWFGTKIGAIRFDGKHWSYRQGKRWLPHDEVRDIAIDNDGNAWVATAGGVSKLHHRPMTLAEKAKYYEDEIDAHHRRTSFGYVIEAHTQVPGKKSDIQLSDSDNDGLWTSMYGAGECFAYGATKAPLAKRRAQAAFKALQFLSEVPKGSKHAPPDGFIARTILETSLGRDPNSGGYTLEGQRQKAEGRREVARIFSSLAEVGR